MPIGNANIHIQINVSEFINKIVSFLFCEFNRVTSWKEGKSIILERSFLKFPNRNPGFIFKVNESQCKYFFPNSNFEGNFSTYVFGKSFWHYRDLKSECWSSRHILCKKILNFSYVWRLEFFVKKLNMYEAHIFSRPLKQTCRLETTTLCLNTRLGVNKKFQNSH